MRLAWSRLATAELRELRRYSIERWGRTVAIRYLADVRDAAKRVAARPDRARLLRCRLRIARVRSHCLIVDIDEEADRAMVVRVLHSAMDIERHLPRD